MKHGYFETDYTLMRFEDGILLIEYKPGLIITIDVAKNCVSDRQRFCEGLSYPVVADLYNIKGTNTEAKTYLASNEAIKGIKAWAIVAKKPFHRLMGSIFISLYLNFNPVKPPVRLFSNIDQARKWALKYREIEG